MYIWQWGWPSWRGGQPPCSCWLHFCSVHGKSHCSPVSLCRGCTGSSQRGRHALVLASPVQFSIVKVESKLMDGKFECWPLSLVRFPLGSQRTLSRTSGKNPPGKTHRWIGSRSVGAYFWWALNVHSVCTNFGLNVHSECANFCLNVHSICTSFCLNEHSLIYHAVLVDMRKGMYIPFLCLNVHSVNEKL